MILLQVVLLIIGFVLLIKGADYLVDGASSIARRFGIRDIVIGLVIVSFGTSAPELVVNLTSAFSGSTDLAVANVVGSNIANILLILGTAAAIYPLTVKKGTVWKEIPLALLASVVLLALINDVLIDNGQLSAVTRIDGIILLMFFFIFLYYSYGISKATGAETKSTVTLRKTPIALAFIIGGIVGLIIGGNFIVNSAVAIASNFGVSEALIGLTIVAIGTSLPELATSAVAAYKKKADIAVGNVVGSNIFNLLFILAATSILRPLPLTPRLNTDIVIMIAASALLFTVMFIGKQRKLERWQGVSMLVLYAAYIGYAVIRG